MKCNQCSGSHIPDIHPQSHKMCAESRCDRNRQKTKNPGLSSNEKDLIRGFISHQLKTKPTPIRLQSCYFLWEPRLPSSFIYALASVAILEKSFVDLSDSKSGGGFDDKARLSRFSYDDPCFATLKNCFAQWHVGNEG